MDRKSGFGLLLQQKGMTGYEVSKATGYGTNAMYRLISGQQSFWCLGLENAQRFADYLFDGDLNELVYQVKAYDLTLHENEDNIRG